MGCRYSSFVPQDLNSFREYDIVAPFWTDLVVGGSNPMYYRLYADDDDSSSDRSRIDDVLNRVSSNIDYYTQTSGFRASCVYVATWDNARLYGSYSVST